MCDNIFKNAPVYPPSWNEVYTRPFNNSEIQMVESCEVVVGQYSLLLEFRLHNGKKYTIPITKESDAYIGLAPDLTKVQLVEFGRAQQRCLKVRIKL